jgi:glycosyltransferase involved in cell wall biosynthesis
MRALYVNQTAQVSGAERSLLSLLKGLRGDPEPLLACPPGELTELAREAGVETAPIVGTEVSFRLHPRHTARGLADVARSALQLRRIGSAFQPDLVHANTTRAALPALIPGLRRRPPVVAHVRDWTPPGRLSRVVLGTVGSRADAIVANSAYVAAQFEGLPLRRPVTTIHNPVDIEAFRPSAGAGRRIREGLGISGGALVLAVIAQLTPWKGQDDAIRTLAALPARGEETVLLIVGSAKFAAAGTQFDNLAYERGLHDLTAELEVADRVRFAGERKDVADVLAAVDVLLLPSWKEAFGRVAIEAMAAGVPVAATEVGGPAEIIRAGVDGILLAPRDPDGWAQALVPVLADARLRSAMGERARERAQDFSLAAHAAAVRTLYGEIAG